MARKLVVDSSVAIKWFMPEPDSSQARLILEAYQTGALDLLAPDLIHAEIGNIVWKKQNFQGLALADALEGLQAFRALKIRFIPTADLLEDAHLLAVKHNRTVYDMIYVALSLREQCSFVTADEKLVNAIRSAIKEVVWLKNWT